MGFFFLSFKITSRMTCHHCWRFLAIFDDELIVSGLFVSKHINHIVARKRWG